MTRFDRPPGHQAADRVVLWAGPQPGPAPNDFGLPLDRPAGNRPPAFAGGLSSFPSARRADAMRVAQAGTDDGGPTTGAPRSCKSSMSLRASRTAAPSGSLLK